MQIQRRYNLLHAANFHRSVGLACHTKLSKVLSLMLIVSCKDTIHSAGAIHSNITLAIILLWFSLPRVLITVQVPAVEKPTLTLRARVLLHGKSSATNKNSHT
jgi:hypothetical protein